MRTTFCSLNVNVVEAAADEAIATAAATSDHKTCNKPTTDTVWPNGRNPTNQPKQTNVAGNATHACRITV